MYDLLVADLLEVGWFAENSPEKLTEDMYPPTVKMREDDFIVSVTFSNEKMTLAFYLELDYDCPGLDRATKAWVKTQAAIGSKEIGTIYFESSRRLVPPDWDEVQCILHERKKQATKQVRLEAFAAIEELRNEEALDDINAALELANERLKFLRDAEFPQYEEQQRFRRVVRETIRILKAKKYDLELRTYAEEVRQFAEIVNAVKDDDLSVWQSLLARAEELKAVLKYFAPFGHEPPYKEAQQLFLHCLRTVTRLQAPVELTELLRQIDKLARRRGSISSEEFGAVYHGLMALEKVPGLESEVTVARGRLRLYYNSRR